jgi:hypothetical protein
VTTLPLTDRNADAIRTWAASLAARSRADHAHDDPAAVNALMVGPLADMLLRRYNSRPPADAMGASPNPPSHG